jgi:broad specificity phosphatase PhoE
MKLVLLRHGDRNSGYGDVDLSSEGQRQAHELADQSALQDIQLLLSSPKNRAQQTIKPLAEKLGLSVTIEAALDQRKSIETQNEFTHRILEFMNHLAKTHPDKNILLCSHSDWLQTAILAMPSHDTNNALHCFFSCADFRVLNFKDGFWEVL